MLKFDLKFSCQIANICTNKSRHIVHCYILYFVLGSNREERIENWDCSNNASYYQSDLQLKKCQRDDGYVPIVAALYMLVSNLVLVNLVIAMFR